MNKYIIGFAFNKDRSKLVLIRKNRPDWQAGKLNGVGGHLELYDATPLDGIVREFHEETGVFIAPKEWVQFGRLSDDIDYDITLFKVFTDSIYDVKTVTDEAIHIFDTVAIPFTECISNLAWLVPMALEVQSKPGNTDIKYDILTVAPPTPEPKKKKFNWYNPTPVGALAVEEYNYALNNIPTIANQTLDQIITENALRAAQEAERALVDRLYNDVYTAVGAAGININE